jgi:hypothetical protein
MTTFINKLLLTALFCSSGVLLMAQQEKNPGNYKIKIYVNGSKEFIKNSDYNWPLSENQTFKYQNKNLDIGTLSFGFEVEKRKNTSNEIEVMPFRFNQQENLSKIIDKADNMTAIIGGGKSTSFSSSFRYQYNYKFLIEKKVIPFIGLSSQLFYDLYKNDPVVSLSYSTRSQDIGLLFSIIPGIEYKLTKILSVELNSPVSFYDIKLNSERIDNPTLEVKDRTVSTIIGDFFPNKINFRIGLSFKI